VFPQGQLNAEKQRYQDYKASVAKIVQKRNEEIRELKKNLQEKEAAIAEREQRTEELSREKDNLSVENDCLRNELGKNQAERETLDRKLADAEIALEGEFFNVPLHHSFLK
jgi:regulator of replication initiation timing